MGGMISSTLLTLVVVPAVYEIVEGARERRNNRSPSLPTPKKSREAAA
jgi:HAE1 family hydrophobic/amphiphilic exporter-1